MDLKKVLTVISIVTVVGTVAVVGLVSAQEPNSDGAKPPAWEQRGPGFGGLWKGGRHGGGFKLNPEHHTERQAALAEALGMSLEDLEAALAEGQTIPQLAEAQGIERDDLHAALQAAHLEQIEQAVADGTLTQEQADRMSERMEQGPQPGFDGPHRGPKRGHGMKGGFGGLRFKNETLRTETHEAVAEALGLSVEELETAKAEGKTMADLAEAQGVDLETVHQAAQSVLLAAIDQAVADGDLTQEQADQLKERIENHQPGQGFGGPGGGRGGHHGRGGFGPHGGSPGITSPAEAQD